MSTTQLRLLPFLTLTALMSGATTSLAQDLGIKAPPQSMPIALVGGTIHPVSAEVIEGGYVFFDGGRILEVGAGERAFIATTRVVDVTGKHVYPGLIGSVTQTGLIEHSAVRATNDMGEVGSIKPEVRSVVAVNPDSTAIPVTRSNGILSVGVFPTGGSIAGRAAVIRMDGWTWEDLAIDPEIGLVVFWPNVRPVRASWQEQSEEEQLEAIEQNLSRIEDAFHDARAYLEAKKADPGTPLDIRWEAMRAVLGGEKPVYVHAQDYDQIVSAVAFAARHDLRTVVVGGRDAHLCADLLAKHDVGVIVGGTLRLPKRDDSHYDEPFRLPLALEKAGLRWSLASGQGTHHERSLPFVAAMAVAHGLPKEAALRSITLSAAELLGVDSELGSLESGKAATLIVTDGDPMEMTTKVQMAFIDGREIDLSNKQTDLATKYREKYRQLEQAGSGRDR